MKGHSRLIWNGSWSQTNKDVFFTVGRDKQLICWKKLETGWTKHCSKICPNAITAIDTVLMDTNTEMLVIGLECGQLHRLKFNGEKFDELEILNRDFSHGGTVNQIRFKNSSLVATCGDDNQVKLFSICSS